MGYPEGSADLVDAHTQRQCAPLKGGEIICAGADEGGYPFVLVKCKDGKERVLVAVRDPEVNGPGDFLVSDGGS